MTETRRFDLLKWVPVAMLAAGVIASGAVDNYRLTALAEGAANNAEAIDENEETIEGIQRLLIERQGSQRLEILRIETEQRSQGEDLEEILLLLQNLSRQ